MRVSTDIRFRRQFIAAPTRIECLPGWFETVLTGKHFLYTHPELPVTIGSEGSLRIVLVGFTLDPQSPERTDTEILASLLVSVRNGTDVRSAAQNLGGRWVLFFVDEQGLTIFNDACGLRQVFYYAAPDGFWCSSQPNLLARFTDVQPDWKLLDEFERGGVFDDREYWWPTQISGYLGVRRLIPNHSLSLPSGTVSRYWPRMPLPSLSLKESATKSAVILRNLVHGAAMRYPLAVTLTAGLDSRCVVAACKDLADRTWFYTWVLPSHSPSDPDVTIPQRLLEQKGYDAHLLPCTAKASHPFYEVYHSNVAFAHAYWCDIAYGLWRHYPQDRISVTGGCSEVGRSPYRLFYRDTHFIGAMIYRDRHPTPAMTVDDFLFLQRGWNRSETIREAIGDWLRGVPDIEDRCHIRVFDLFYWEHRMGSWQATSQAEWDIVHETFCPFNNRMLLSILLSADESDRITDRVHRGMVNSLWPELLREPVNPRPVVRWDLVKKAALDLQVFRFLSQRFRR